MNIRFFLVVLAGVFWLWPAGRAWPAAFVSQASSEAHALVVSAGPGDEAALAALSETLVSNYGVSRERLTWIKGGDATSARIEQALVDRMQRLNPNDQLFVMLALRMHAKGDDKILVTSDFEPAKPWTGFPVLALQKLTARPTGATVLVFHPECQSRGEVRQSNADMAQQSYNRNQQRQTRTMIGFCAESPALITAFVRSLDAALIDLAKNPGTRAPWQSANDRGLIGVADLAGRLAAGDGGRDLVVEEGTGWLRVTGTPQDGDGARALTNLRTAKDSANVKSALGQVVASVQDAQSPVVVDQAASALSAYALDDSRDEAWRTLAVQALGDLPSATARMALEGVYANAQSGAVRRSVLNEWHGISGELEPRLVRDALDDDDPQVRIAAIQMVGLLNDFASREAVLRQLEQAQDPQVRAAAARVLTSLARPEDDPAPLLRALKDGDAAVRVEAAGAVARLPANPAAVQPLFEAFSDSDARVRESAAYALGRHWSVMDEAVASTIAQAMIRRAGEQAGTAERVASLWALARGKRGEFTSEIAAILRGPGDVEVRLAAVEALDSIADQRAVPALVEVTGEEDVEPRLLLAAIRALGLHDTRPSVDRLFELAASPNPDVGETAVTALAKLSTPAPAAIVLASKAETAPALRMAAIDHLGRSGDRDSTKVLLDLLGSADPALSQRAAYALSMNGSVAMVAKLGSLLEPDGNNDALRVAAATALVAMNSDDARVRLAGYRNDPVEAVRLKVVESVDVKSGNPRGLDTLLAMVGDQSPAVRAGVAGKLGQIDEAGSQQALRGLSTDAEASVRSVAIDGLRSLDSGTRVAAENTGDSMLVYSRTSGEGRALRVDVFWCRGPGEEARLARARSLADELALLARSGKLAPDAIASIRVRPLNEATNKERGYRIAGNQIRFEPGDAWERAWVDRFLAMWGNEFVAHPVVNRTEDYISFFRCGGSR